MMLRVTYACILLCSLVLSCSKQEPPRAGAIPEETFVNLYANVLITQEEGNLSGLDSVRTQARIDSICGTYHVSPEQFRSTLGGYRTDLARWRELNEKVSKRLEAFQREEVAVKGKK